MTERPTTSLRRSVRWRILLIALLPLLILLPLLLVTAVQSWTARFDEVLIGKVHSELTTAHQHLDELVQSRGAAVAALAQSTTFAQAQGAGLAGFMKAEQARFGFDFLYVLPSASVLAGDDRTRWPVIHAALAGQMHSAIDVYEADDLAALAPELAERALFKLVPTRAAKPSDRQTESRGMVVHAAAPAPGGVLVGGILLNRNLGFIDQMNDLVYPANGPKGANQGTATLFLDDVRISTNVRLFEDVRALGTRVSAAVRSRVLDEGQVWLDRAFVVNDWYVSAYEPIIDSFGTRVGMLYVGFLEAPYAQAKRQTLYQIAITFGLVVLLSAPVLLRWARGIFKPLELMDGVIRDVETGNLGARVGVNSAEDEISRLAMHLDTLLDQLQERERRLRDWAEELESRVAERTSELEQANRQLDMTTRQLIVSEKLAAIGEITAGIAHEINNPLAVIQGNLDVVREDLGVRAEPLRTEFSLIQEQIQSIHILVSKLLRFARPEEYAESGEGFDPGQTLHETLPLVQHLLNDAHIHFTLNLQARNLVQINQTELQQVLVNLLVNAIQAMPEGGSLAIETHDVEQDGAAMVEMTLSDTGIGMEPEILARIFDPFFTTKRAEGTGLGLSISRNLMIRAGGQLDATSTPGKGSRFTLLLPSMLNLAHDTLGNREASLG
jgi:two-component system NtrC family sensor kinase